MVITSYHHEILGLGLVLSPRRLKSVAAVRAAHHLRRHRGRRATVPARHGDIRRKIRLEIWKSHGTLMEKLC